MVQAKEDATEFLNQKIELEKEKKLTDESAAEKDKLLRVKIKTIGNIVADTVPVSNNEVWQSSSTILGTSF